MYSSISNIGAERENPRMFNSFSQCNNYLLSMDEYDLSKYLNVVHTIPYDHDLSHYSTIDDSAWIRYIVEYFINISSYDARAFKIQVSTLNHIGFDVDDQINISTKWIRSIFGRNEGPLKRELRFLKRSKLTENIDYIANTQEVNGVMVDTGYSMTRAALYRLVSNRYGVKFLEAVMLRMAQILFYFNEYKISFNSTYITSLKRTINGLNDDIKSSNEEIQKLNNMYPTTYEDVRTKSYSFNRSSNSLDSYISSDVIMNTKEYADELSTIHTTIEGFVNKVDGRISDVHCKLLTITTKIDDLVGSIALTRDECRPSICSRCSRCSNSASINLNPVLDHVRNIFREFEEFDSTRHSIDISSFDTSDTVSLRGRSRSKYFTCIGNEHHL